MMAKFDPDAYLKETAPAFDPDQYLGTKPQPRGTVPEEAPLIDVRAKRLGPDISKMGMGATGVQTAPSGVESLQGPATMPGAIAQGLAGGAANIAAGALDIGSRLAGSETGKKTAKDIRKAISSGLEKYKSAYPMTTGAAQFAGEMAATLPVGGLLAKPVQAIGAALPSTARVTAPLAQSIASGGFQTGLQPGVANMLTKAAGGAVFGKASGALINPEDSNTSMLVGAVLPGASNVLAGARKLVRGAEQTPQMQAAIQSAREAGYVIPPSQARDSAINKALEGVADRASVSKAASAKNQVVTNRLANETIGLSPDVQLNQEVLDAVRAEAGKAYQAVSGLGDFSITGGVKLPAEVNVKSVLDPYTMTYSNKVDSGELVRAWKQANSDATAYYRAYGRDANPETLAKAKAASDTAKKVDQFLNDQLKKAKLDDLLSELKAARVQIAKTYSIENALNPVTGNVDARKLAAQLQKGKVLSGGLETAGRFASQFKQSAQVPEQMGSIPGFSLMDVLLGGAASAATGNAAGALAAFTRPVTRAATMSNIVQNRLLQKPQAEFYNKLIQGGPNYTVGTVQPLVERQ
jgi:hypothetical protein